MPEHPDRTTHALTVLEYEQVFSLILARARSPEGRQSLRSQGFCDDPVLLRSIQRESRELQSLLVQDGYPLPEYPDIAQPLEDCRVEGSVLELEDVAAVALYVDAAERELGWVHQQAPPEAAVREIATAGEIPQEVGKVIWRYLDRSGRLMEDRIPELQRIAARIHSASQAARDTAQRFLRQATYRDFWTSDEPALRDGRLVLPLQENYRGRISGIVHTRSASGTTLFFEPAEIVEANNRVTDEQSAYQVELQRILRRMSAVIREHRAVLEQLRQQVGRLDDRCARARFALQQDAVWLPVTEDSAIRLVQARHPLLGSAAVPISLEISGDPQRFIVLSGPNTGGKTVALKTLGLLAALHQHALPVPAADGTRLPLFSAIHADIGDEQSIERSLSTFSGHIGRIKRILAEADARGLVLLDELGTGTDPDEAGALGVAICEHLVDTGCMGIITTHLWALKEFSFSSEAFFNAAMAFDEQTHRPTYAVVPGLPGSSYALDTAEAIGLQPSILGRARELVEADQTSSAALLKRLAEQERRIQAREHELAALERELQRRHDLLQEQQQQLSQREGEVRRGQLQELDALLAAGRSRIEQTVKELREGELSSARIQAAKAGMHELEDQSAQVKEAAARDAAQRRIAEAAPQPGAIIRMHDSGKQGVIQRSAGKKRWKASFGSISLTVHERDFSVMAADQEASVQQSLSKPLPSQTPQKQPVYTVDVRGMRAHEAQDCVGRALDDALVQGRGDLAVIHGKGSGALQQAIQELLRQHPSVENFGFARPELGGSGKTEIRLRA
ncbi:endonuclease MutS2 [Spirochaeta africana]|nr:Smr/MutS family protein [Spirochaeta africana]